MGTEAGQFGRSDIESAIDRLDKAQQGFLRETPLWRLPGAALGLGCAQVWLKLEHLQVGGSFKARGMYNRMLAQPLGPSGVIIASGGNAGIATAAAAQSLGVPCEVFLPKLASAAKRERLRELGATVCVEGEFYAEAFAACLARQQQTGALLMHAYDQPEVVAGAATLAAEIEAQAGLPDTVLVSVGGGGLIAGVAAWFGESAQVRHSLLVEDAAIRAAQLTLWQQLKLAVEPAAALGLAALHSGAWVPHKDEVVCLILCGANMDPGTLVPVSA